MVVNLNVNAQNLGTLYTDPTIGDNLSGSANLAAQNEIGLYNPTDSISLSAMAQSYLDGQPETEQVPETVPVTALRPPRKPEHAFEDPNFMSALHNYDLLNSLLQNIANNSQNDVLKLGEEADLQLIGTNNQDDSKIIAINGRYVLVRPKEQVLKDINKVQAFMSNTDLASFVAAFAAGKVKPEQFLGVGGAAVFKAAVVRAGLAGLGVEINIWLINESLEKYEEEVSKRPADWIEYREIGGSQEDLQEVFKEYKNWVNPPKVDFDGPD